MAQSSFPRQIPGPKAVFVIAALLLMGLTGWLLFSSHENAQREVAANTRNLSSVLEARLSATLAQADANLKELSGGSATYILQPSLVPTYNEEITRVLNQAVIRTPEAVDYAYADANGNVLYAAKAGTLGTLINDKPYFVKLASTPKIGATFSDVTKSMLDGKPGLIMARPVLAGDGHVMGAVLAFLDIGRMESLIPDVDLGASGVVSIRKVDDGHLLVRKPFLAEAVNQPLEGSLVMSRIQTGVMSGVVSDAEDADGNKHFASFKRLSNYPFFVVAAVAEGDYLEGWYLRSGALIVAVLGVLALLAWALKRMEASQESLLAESDEHEGQETLLRTVIDEIPGVVLVKDYEGRFVLGNQALADLYGTTTEDLVGKDDGAFNPNGQQVAFYKANVQEIMDDGNPQVVFEESTDTVTGEVRCYQSLKKPFVGENGEPHILVVASDVTELRDAQLRAEASEKRLQYALNAAGDGLWDWQIKTGELFNNARWGQILGRTAEDVVHHLSDFEAHLPDEQREHILSELQAATSSGQPFCMRHPMRRMDGAIIWVEDKGEVVEWDDQGQPSRMVGRLTDITDQVASEQVLREAKDAAEHASQAKSQFLANLSHEIRTPLHGIMGMAEILHMGGLPKEQENAVDTIRASARGLLNVLGDMLDFSLMEKGKLTLLPGTFALGETARELVESRRPEAERRGLALNCILRGNAATLEMKADESRLRQVLGNLLDNAIKFTAKGSVTLTLSVAPDDHVRFDVIDTGIGMTEDVVKSLFTPFYQADGGLTRAYGGTGMGLSVCKQLLDYMGGTIDVRSTPGQGSQFTVVLPQHCQDSADQLEALTHLEAETASAITAEAVPLSGARVLLVDDNAITRQVANGMLDWLGCDTALASNGSEALDRIRQEPFDLVLMDLKMPVMDGLEATRKLRMGACGPEGAHLPVIAMATSPSPEEEAECLAAGMNDYLTKAIDLDTLGEALTRWIPEGRAPLIRQEVQGTPVAAPVPVAVALADVPPPAVESEAPTVAVDDGVPAPLAARLEALAQQVSAMAKSTEQVTALMAEQPQEIVPEPAPEAPSLLAPEAGLEALLGLPSEPVIANAGDSADELPALDFPLDMEPTLAPTPLPAEPVAEPVFAPFSFEPTLSLPETPELAAAPVFVAGDDPAFDKEGMLSLCMHDKDLVEVILRSALNDVSSYWESLVTAVRQEDSGTAAFWVHTLKTLMSQAGGVSLERKMESLENELKEGRVLSENEVVAEVSPSLEGFRQGALACLRELRE